MVGEDYASKGLLEDYASRGKGLCLYGWVPRGLRLEGKKGSVADLATTEKGRETLLLT
jgi:hypothetical protein